jgi:mannose-6-phosphate isomerase
VVFDGHAAARAGDLSMSALDAIRAHAARARAWLFDAALPLWWTRGFDTSTGLWREKLALDASPDPGATRRVRVQARQTAVYALAGALGWKGPWRDAVEAGVAVLIGRARAPGGGPVHLLDASGAVADPRVDLYDRAFFLFALAHAARALQREALIGECVTLMNALAPLPQGGFDEGAVAPAPPHRQNPHMHLFEAMLTLAAVTGDARWRSEANGLGALFRDRFFEPQRGVLPEHFDAGWRPLRDIVVEPGHQYEWAWLLGEWARAGGDGLWDAQERMVAFAERHGVAAHGAAWDELNEDGTVRARSSRLWPNTERIKAGVALYERTGRAEALALAARGCDALFAYLDVPVAGLWRDRRREDGRFVDEPAPASSFYHIVMAFAELLRVDAMLA